MSELKKLLDQRSESGAFWKPEKKGAALIGVIVNTRPDSFKPEVKTYTIKAFKLENEKWDETGELFQTPSHTTLRSALEAYEAEIGDFVQIIYEGQAEKASKWGQKAQLYSVGVVKREVAETYLGRKLPKPTEEIPQPEPKTQEPAKPGAEGDLIKEGAALIKEMLATFDGLPMEGDGSIDYFLNKIRGMNVPADKVAAALNLVEGSDGKYRMPK